MNNQVILSISFYNALYKRATEADRLEEENEEMKERLYKLEKINGEDEQIKPSTYQKIYQEGRESFLKGIPEF